MPFQTRLFHLGLYFKHPVIIHEVVHGIAHPIPYFKELFQYGVKLDVPSQVGDLGFAGFRVGVTPDFDADMFAFLGASILHKLSDL